jgi:hypothetical protein
LVAPGALEALPPEIVQAPHLQVVGGLGHHSDCTPRVVTAGTRRQLSRLGVAQVNVWRAAGA